jgi:hypothetical protein
MAASTVTLTIPCQSADGTSTGIECASGTTAITVQALMQDNTTTQGIDTTVAGSLFTAAVAGPLCLYLIARGGKGVIDLFSKN